MKGLWFKLFACGVLVVVLLGGLRWAAATVRRGRVEG